jgi:lysophospholipase L1-like esterase/predicted esterase
MGPAATADVQQILRNLRKQYRIDKVVISGGSMGGTSAAAFTAMHPELVDGVVSLNGTSNLLEYDQFQDAIAASYGGTKNDKPDVYRERSAEFFPDRFTMPTAFTTGGQDKLVPPDSTLRLAKSLEERRLPVKSIHRPEGGHDTNYDDSRAAFDFVMERVIRGPDLPPPLLDLTTKPVKIVCLGDSVTGVYYHTGGRRAYPELLEIALKKSVPNANVTVINAGISGHTTENGLSRLDRDVLQHQPDLVTISFGLNDVTRLSTDQYRTNLEQLIDRCRERKAAVVLCTPNAVIDTSARPITKLNEFCAIIRDFAKQRDVGVCDQFYAGNVQRQRDPWNWRLTLSDEIHPNGDGHRRMAEELCRTIAGKHVSLEDLGPPRPALPRLRKQLADKQRIRILAMQPIDSHIAVAVQTIDRNAMLEVTPWTTAGQSLAQIEQDAKKLVRSMKPDLLLLTIPRDAAAPNDEQFIRSVSWIMNCSLSFGQQEWDVVVVHPAVFDATPSPRDELVRQLVHAQDIDLIDRLPTETRSGAILLMEWLQQQLRE